MPSQKKPAALTAPRFRKQVRPNLQLGNYDNERPVWRVSTLDIGGPWCWKCIDGITIWAEIYDKISHFEKMTWLEIKQHGSHSIKIDELCPEARKRLEQIQLDDVEELFSLRLTGKQRIWGIRHNAILKILWWDPGHEVCPSEKKHT